MPSLQLDAKALEAYLPHRGLNLLPDTVTMSEDRMHAVSRTRIPANDPRGRRLFARKVAGGEAWYEPFLAELMALTGVPLLHERLAPKGEVAVFSMISRLTFFEPAPLDRELIGYADITRDRGAFTVFSTRAEVDGRKLLEAEVMSGCAPFTQLSARPADATAAPAGAAIEPATFAWKDPRLPFVDRVISEDAANGKVSCAYTYPRSHPLVPGHFPQAAVMMGVTQWAAFADATWVACRRFGLGERVIANGTIRRAGGGEILDVRDLELRVEGGFPRIHATKRIAFREPVLPGESVIVDAAVVRG
jgi:3-hydroxymyristoyl/3-hydroxydecanoyl-(acyl carrier protein) dehydratase